MKEAMNNEQRSLDEKTASECKSSANDIISNYRMEKKRRRFPLMLRMCLDNLREHLKTTNKPL